MATAVKKIKKKVGSKKVVAANKKVKNYGKDPLFVKKANAMESLLKKHGTPNTIVHS